LLAEELQQWRDHWKMTPGKMALEIHPKVDFDKGKAVREILRTFPHLGFLPIYLGDDQTDEEAFRVLKGQGISVVVGPGSLPSEANFFLRSPDEVCEFLFKCLMVRRGAGHSPNSS
jgi:trehalose 6-phosphate phosphatase